MNIYEKTYLNILREEAEEQNYVQDVQTLFIITGAPGSGKSFTADIIKKQYVAKGLERPEHFEADMWFYKDGKYRWFKEGLAKAHEWCQNSVRAALEDGKTVIVSNTSRTPRERAPYIQMARDNNVHIEFIEAKGEYQNIHNVPTDAVQRMRKTYVPISDDERGIIKEDVNKRVITEISKNDLHKLIDKEKLQNTNKRFNIKQISKYFLDTNPNILYYVLKVNNIVKAICVVNIKNNICKIKQIGSLEKGCGYGKSLLDYFLNSPFRMIYLCANWEDSDKLLNYYRNKSFYLKEYKNPISQIHWFYKNRMMTFKSMNDYIDKYFV